MPLCRTSKTPKWTVLKVIYAQDILTSLDLAGILSSRARGNVIHIRYSGYLLKSTFSREEGLVFLPKRRDILRPCCNSPAVTVCCMKSASTSPPNSGLCPKFQVTIIRPKKSTQDFLFNFLVQKLCLQYALHKNPQGRWPMAMDIGQESQDFII